MNIINSALTLLQSWTTCHWYLWIILTLSLHMTAVWP